MIFMTGGPPHQDMYDLKPDAPAEIRGPFRPIATRIAGIQVCEQYRRQVDAVVKLNGGDSFHDQAFNILASGKLATALDLSKEDPQVVDRYGHGDSTQRLASVPQHFLIARRLIEAGVRVVTLNHAIWDWHSDSFKNSEKQFPVFDKAITALVEDLHERGLADDVTVLAWGEFGRTPKINAQAGRDHWPQVSCALLAGGGMRTGQVIGSTDRMGSQAENRPVTFQEVFATLYHNLGIDVQRTTIPDFNGRPHYLVESGVEPLRELIS